MCGRVERANGPSRTAKRPAQLQDTVVEALGSWSMLTTREGPGTTAHVQAKLARRTQKRSAGSTGSSVHHAAVEVVGAQPKD